MALGQTFGVDLATFAVDDTDRLVTDLREAAARYQSNVLLAYRVTGDDYTKYRMTRPDQVKAYCSVEAFLLDVRSGIVPLMASGFKEISAQKEKQDLSFDETTDKAFRNAEADALVQVAEQVRSFLDSR